MKVIEEILNGIEEIKARLDKLTSPPDGHELEKKLMTFKEVCSLLRFTPKYLYKLCYTKKIPFHNPTGRTLFFYWSEIDEWIRSNPDKRRRR